MSDPATPISQANAAAPKRLIGVVDRRVRATLSRSSTAVLISLLALFVALGGTGYAALMITGRNVKDDSLTGRDIKDRSLTGKDIRNDSLGGEKLEELASDDFEGGALPPGPRGPEGPQGPPGPGGADGSVVDLAPEAVHPVSLVAHPGGPLAFEEVCPQIEATFCFNYDGAGNLTGSWTNKGAGYQAVGFWKDATGLVHLQGTTRYGGAPMPDLIFVLPSGYRPNATLEFAVRIDGGLGSVRINSGGWVIASSTTPNTLPLDGIAFRVQS